MDRESIRRGAILAGGFLGIWLFLKFLFPIFLPFFLGLLLALAAEPVVRLATRLKVPRWAATGIGVSLTLIFLTGLTGLLGASVVKELGVLAGRLPDLQDTATQTADKLRVFLENAADKAPEGVQPLGFSRGLCFLSVCQGSNKRFRKSCRNPGGRGCCLP